ncbi:unnamed protein product [Urochloa decumbens]|uniref:DUF6598 domain-containing protein n=1 Tax=Urochloa decumbens TaxID=240449 RepID=A0ABC8XJ14_9POAL
MANLAAYVPPLVKDFARLDAEAEIAAKLERDEQVQREIMRKFWEDRQRRRDGDPDAERAEEEEESEEDDSEEDEEELAEGEAMWERMHLLNTEERRARYWEAEKRILDYDPKQGGVYYTRIYLVHDLVSFDHDEESPIPPMRFTNAVYKNKNDYELCEAVNILSVKIGSLDIEFPIHVYGTVIARDSLDKKCVYLFRRDREESQTINSKDESLILTGPKRGLALISNTYVETNLIIKGDQNQEERPLSKGILTIPGMERRDLTRCELESCSLATKLSTVDVVYAVVKDAVEATISIEVLAGDFFGEITACTSSIKERLVLHDRLAHITSGKKIAQIIPLLRSVVAVYVKEKLLLTIVAHTEDGESTKCIDYTPRVNGSSLDEITVGLAVLGVKVVWSIIDY